MHNDLLLAESFWTSVSDFVTVNPFFPMIGPSRQNNGGTLTRASKKKGRTKSCTIPATVSLSTKVVSIVLHSFVLSVTPFNFDLSGRLCLIPVPVTRMVPGRSRFHITQVFTYCMHSVFLSQTHLPTFADPFYLLRGYADFHICHYGHLWLRQW